MNRRYKVLIVDDEEGQRVAIQDGFRLRGHRDYSVTAVASIAQANEAMKSETSFDVVIIDLQMGRIRKTVYDGFSALFAIHCIAPSGVVVVYSAHAEVEHVVRAMQLGANSFISKKDARPHELVMLIEDMLQDVEERDRVRQALNSYMVSNCQSWVPAHVGKVLAIGINPEEPSTPHVEIGDSRLDALVKYSHWRDEVTPERSRFSVTPHLHVVDASVDTGRTLHDC